MYLKSISNYRAIAIIAIVASHIYGFGLSSPDPVTYFIKSIITGSTGLFVFISGFMFYYVFYKKYEYKHFIKNKILNIGVPYSILAIIAICITYFLSSGYFNANSLSSYSYRDGIIFKVEDSTFTIVLKYYATGRFLTAYWYIPFALILFASAPIHIFFISLRKRLQLEVVILLSLVSIFGHRPVAETNPFQSLVYYTPIYLIGILVAMNRNKVKVTIENKKAVIILIFLVFTFTIVQYSTGHIGNYNKLFFYFDGMDFMYLQKISLILLVYIFLEKYSFNLYFIDVISKTSFSIFFIHPWLIILFKEIFYNLGFVFYPEENNLFLYMFMLVLILSISVLISLSIKKSFKYSIKTRYLIGY
ncbi:MULTISPECIES: acyltransferase family protein [unclassified Psychrobacter]|uniref:acyltransferase family protein n=1 Tax=unclassified Psychrobacter TaxID=196806 RepID=UPI00071E9B84|nr:MULTISPECIES: acyltransferase [unclassified Psychrobacter]OLF37657.1 hypothetical protein BTV98_08660 [Psychrobacter sp. Cmf 22.2]